MPEMTDEDWVRLDVSQDLDRAASMLGGTGGRVEVAPKHQQSAKNTVDRAMDKLEDAGIRDNRLARKAEILDGLASLPNSALNLYYDMLRAKGRKLRLTKNRQIDATVLIQRGYAREQKSGKTTYIKPVWADNPIKGMPGGSVSGCIAQNQDKDDPGAYCAAIADRIEPGWRSKGRKGKRKSNPNGTADLVRRLKF